VIAINHILKSRARRYVAAAEEEWLYPEKAGALDWRDIGKILLPPDDELWHFGGEIILHRRADDELNLLRLQGIAPGHFVQCLALKEDVGIGK
jgi:hypothetical protein